jgi:hypothetical protein
MTRKDYLILLLPVMTAFALMVLAIAAMIYHAEPA